MEGTESGKLREMMRILVRHLGILEKSDLNGCDITLAQCHALVEIGRRERMNLNDLALLLNVDKSTMSRTINNLVENGLAVRDQNDGDRRYIVIQLTEEGKRFFECTEADMAVYYRSILNRIPAGKQAQVMESMALLIDAIGHERR